MKHRNASGRHTPERVAQDAQDCWSEFERLQGREDRVLTGERQSIAADWRLVAFVGSFNSGKSSLIDCLLGQPLLPVGRFPETGAACFVHRGDQDVINVHHRGAAEQIPLSTEALHRLMRLTKAGRRVDNEGLPNVVRITSSSIPIPEDMVLLDTPGLNDDLGTSERAMMSAESADALVFVATSKAFLSLAEVKALRELQERRGLDGLIVVLNEFLEEDGEEEFEERRSQDILQYRARMADVLDDLGLDTARVPLLQISARAAAASPDRFGGPEFRAAIMGNPDRNWEALVSARRMAAARRGNAHVHAVSRDRLEALEPGLAEAEEAHAEATVAGKSMAAFTLEARRLVERVINEFAPASQDIGAALCAKISGGTLARDGSYTAGFRGDVALRGRMAHQALLNGVNALVLRHRQDSLDGGAEALIAKLLSIQDEVAVDAPDTRVTGTAAYGAMGAAIGLPFGGVGAMITGPVAAAFGRKAAEKADREKAAKNADEAGKKVRALITALTGPITEAVLRCRRQPRAVSPLDTTLVEAWRRVHAASAPLPASFFVPFGAELMADAP